MELGPGVVVANKLWWEWWPEQSAAEELDASLGRMGLDHVDLIYAERPPDGLAEPERGRSLWGRLRAGAVPDWLEPVGDTGQAFAVYRVKR